MKQIITILAITATAVLAQAQVAIERTDNQVRGAAIMDFSGDGTTTFATKGILLPKVDGTVTNPTKITPGAMAYDLALQQVVYYNDDTSNGQTAGWKPMTATSETTVTENEHSGTQQYTESLLDTGTIIADGTSTSTAEGVLVLESASKALILPQVEDVTQLPGPKAGMICYDMATDSMAVFNGTVWSFWN